ncbi:hypothetical protein BJ917_2833 [Pseudomonas sp. WPR_5_2]|nr:hypothetical protein BJ917_2833 [Pseudomonas sp. WPR_5_2]
MNKKLTGLFKLMIVVWISAVLLVIYCLSR